MNVSPKADKFLHSKLPIDDDEQILAVYRHHWFAYASSWIIGVILIVLVMGIAVAFTTLGNGNEGSGMMSQTQTMILAGGAIFSALVLLGTSIPVYLRSQEQLVLTDEAVLQVLQPSLFASMIDQVSLQHIADVSVQQDFFGTIFGFGHITLETPGEQNNYRFATLPSPHEAAKEIIAAHENFAAALQSGRLQTTLGAAVPPAPNIDPQQYQQFLQYQQMVAQQQNDQTRQGQGPVAPVSADPNGSPQPPIQNQQ
jgi:hypothetical protein